MRSISENVRIRSAGRWALIGSLLGPVSYATYAGVAWFRYGCMKSPSRKEDVDHLLDRFIPTYEVVDRHQIRIGAPAPIALAAACELDLQQSPLIRAIFRTRELILRSTPQNNVVPRTLLAMAKATGWSVLAEIPGREVVVGTITRPWEANVVFHAIPRNEFAAFHEPGWVKIAWTLRADPIDADHSVAKTETRVVTTDPYSRGKFRRYWAFVSPGIKLIRRLSLKMAKQEAERRVRGESTKV